MFNRSGSGSTTWENDGHSGFSTDDGGYVGYTSDDTAFNSSPGSSTALPEVTVTLGNQKSYQKAADQIFDNINKTRWYNNYNQTERTLFGNGLQQVNEKYGVIVDYGNTATSAYLSTKGNKIKRKFAYELSKHIDAKSGQIYQNGQKIVRKGSKLLKKMGPLGNALSAGTIAYEIGTDTWDAHTVVDGGMLVAGTAATVFLASNPVGWAILGGIAIYGVIDFAFGTNDIIDEKIGRNSGLWD